MTATDMIPCDHAIAKLWENIEGELTDESAAAVRAHLEVCSRCFPQYHFHRAFKEFLHRSSRTPLPRRSGEGSSPRSWRVTGVRGASSPSADGISGIRLRLGRIRLLLKSRRKGSG